MAVETFALRAITYPVLHHRGDAVSVDAARSMLKALDVRAHHPSRELGVFAEGAGDASPARLGGEVRLRRERHLDADGAIFLPRNISEAANQRRVADGGEAERLRPLREDRRDDAGAGDVLKMVSRIGADGERNPESGTLGDLLERIVLRRQRRRVADEPRDHRRDFRAVDERAIGRGVVARAHAGNAQRTAGARGAVHHRPCFLLERHARDEIARASVRGTPPVFVRIELSISIEVAEAEAVLFDDRRGARAEVGLRGLRGAESGEEQDPGQDLHRVPREIWRTERGATLAPGFCVRNVMTAATYGTVKVHALDFAPLDKID